MPPPPAGFAVACVPSPARERPLLYRLPVPQVDPRMVPHSFFSDRSEYIDEELSRKLVNGLHKIGMLDEQVCVRLLS